MLITRVIKFTFTMIAWFSKKDGDGLVTGKVPPIDKEAPEETKTATFSMGCFWGPDALFGSKNGVVRTRVGYTGGSKENPTYRSLGDHTETIQMDYDPEKITYRELLEIFWNDHDPTMGKTIQYRSMISLHDEEQKRYAMRSKEHLRKKLDKEVKTVMVAHSNFYPAEDYHQKYKLRRNSWLYEAFRSIYPDIHDFVDSTAVARANGLVDGKGRIDTINELGLNEEGKELLYKIWNRYRGGYL